MTTKEMREMMNLSRAAFCRKYNIPKRTVEDWENGKRHCPPYVTELLTRCAMEDYEKEKKSAK